jgi:hypothetical protein
MELIKLMEVYVSPDVQILDIFPEGVLCGSNEIVDENFGEW